MNPDNDIQKPRLGWNIARKENGNTTPTNTSIARQGSARCRSPAVSVGRTSTCTPDGNIIKRASTSKSGRKESIKVNSDLQGQKKMLGVQGKLLQLKSQTRKESLMKEGGIKTLMAAPSVMNAFKRNVTVSVKSYLLLLLKEGDIKRL
jgi:hypothetical protein